MKKSKFQNYHEVDSAQDKKSFDEARYYEGDQFELGGVDFGYDQSPKHRSPNSRIHHRGWDRPGRHSADYGIRSGRQERYQAHEPYFEKKSQSSHRGKGPKNYQRSNERLMEDISEALYRSSDVDAREIIIDVKDGLVYLKGTVESREAKKLAERCVENISGVKDVFNMLTLSKQEINSGLSEPSSREKPSTLEDLDRFRMV